jgi:hypothetical protein
LVQSLGWVNAVRFIQQYETSKLDYTKERAGILPDWDAAEMVRQMKAVAPQSIAVSKSDSASDDAS